MHKTDIIIVGAGAAGLMAAYALSKTNLKITVLEARNRIGGRINTLHDKKFSIPIESGAEFIHGKLKYTLQLLNEAGIGYKKMEGKIWKLKNGNLQKNESFIEEENELAKCLKELKEDITVEKFLKKNFPGDKYAELRKSVKKFVEGYDAANATRASSFALREELEQQDENQYRIEGGYIKLMRYLEKKCKATNFIIKLSTIVKKINRPKGMVEIKTTNGKIYRANKVIVTIPIPLLSDKTTNEGSIQFTPALPQIQKAIKKMGYGAVIKISIQFKNAFWEKQSDIEIKRKMNNLGFLFTQARIPTWWTQLPNKTPILTGWLAGPQAAALKEASDNTILTMAIDSLSGIFGINKKILNQQIISSSVFNWGAQPFSMGAYTYATVETKEARNVLSEPIDNCIFISGEAVYDGPAGSTVEAALRSGLICAGKILTGL